MSHFVKDAFLKEKQFQATLNSLKSMQLSKDEKKKIQREEIDQELVAKSLSCIERANEGCSLAYVRFDCINQEIESINGLEKFVYLKYVDLSFNKLTSIKALSNCKFLIDLNVSNNSILKLLDVKNPIITLERVNYNFNKVQ